MKKLILFCATIALFSAPLAHADRIVKTNDGRQGDSLNPKNSSGFPKAGESASVYVDWVRKNLELTKQAWMMRYAKYVHPENVKCLDYIGAYYNFSESGNSHTFSCFAVPIKKSNAWITHKLTYNIEFGYSPSECASNADLETFFATASNRTPAALKQKIAFINKSCVLTIPTLPSDEITMENFNPNDLSDILNYDEKTNVEVYLEKNGRKKGVGLQDGGNGGQDCANILRCNKTSAD